MPTPHTPSRYLRTGPKPPPSSTRLHGAGTTLNCGGRVGEVSSRGAMMKAAYMETDRGVLHGHGGDIPGAKGCYYCWTGQYKKCKEHRSKSPSLGTAVRARPRSRSRSRSRSRGTARSKTPVRSFFPAPSSSSASVVPVTPYSTISLNPRPLRSPSSSYAYSARRSSASSVSSPSARSITSTRNPPPTKTDRQVVKGITSGKYHTIQDLPMPGLFASP